METKIGKTDVTGWEITIEGLYGEIGDSQWGDISLQADVKLLSRAGSNKTLAVIDLDPRSPGSQQFIADKIRQELSGALLLPGSCNELGILTAREALDEPGFLASRRVLRLEVDLGEYADLPELIQRIGRWFRQLLMSLGTVRQSFLIGYGSLVTKPLIGPLEKLANNWLQICLGPLEEASG